MEIRALPTTVTAAALVSSLTEGDAGTPSFRFTRDNTSGILTVNMSWSGSAAGGGTDYSTYPTTVIFGAGSSTADVGVTPVNDSTSEPTETITCTITSGSYTIGDPSSATIDLLDNDAQYVSVEKISDAEEGGADGIFRFTRTGDLSGSLAVSYIVGGDATGTDDDDYEELSGTVTFLANAATADVDVVTTPDSIYDPDETIAVTIDSGTGYSIGAEAEDEAELTIADDIDAVQALIHQETFQLTGTSGNVDVTLTVTYNAPGAEGLYTWSYVVSNPSSNTTDWADFTVPVDNTDGLSDVGNLTSSIGWTGTVGTDSVSWSAGTALSPGNSATFSFTTDPREVGEATVETTDGGSALADGAAPAPGLQKVAPRATYHFYTGRNQGSVTLSMTLASGSTETTDAIPLDAATGHDAREQVYDYLKDAGWVVKRVGDNGIEIRGKTLAGQPVMYDVAKTATSTVTNWHAPGQGYADKPMLVNTSQVPVTNN
jgi:hypothetical protein